MSSNAFEQPGAGSAPRKIPVFDLIKAGCETVFGDFDKFVRGATNWALVAIGSAVARVVAVLWFGAAIGGILSILATIGVLVATTAFLVAWHRRVLVGEPLTGAMIFEARERRFFLYTLAPLIVGFVAMALMLSVAFMGMAAGDGGHGAFGPVWIVGLLILIGVLVVSPRLALFAPLAALDAPGNLFVCAWEISRGNGVRIFGGLLAIGLLFEIPMAILRPILAVILGRFLTLVLWAGVHQAVAFAEVACMAGFLCYAFAHILDRKLPFDLAAAGAQRP